MPGRGVIFREADGDHAQRISPSEGLADKFGAGMLAGRELAAMQSARAQI
jgi:hypothetical protein